MIAKMILSAMEYGCSEEAITIAAVLSIQVKSYPAFIIFFIFFDTIQLSIYSLSGCPTEDHNENQMMPRCGLLLLRL